MIDRTERPGRIGLLLALAGLVVGAAVALGFLASEWAQPLILGLLAVLSVIGVFSLFAYSIGLFHVGARSTQPDLTRTLVDEHPDAVLVTDGEGRVLYANRRYRYLALDDLAQSNTAHSDDMSAAPEIKPVERLLSGSTDVSEVVYRLTLAAREGRALMEEVRLSPPPGPACASSAAFAPSGQPARATLRSDAAWYRVQVEPLATGAMNAQAGKSAGKSVGKATGNLAAAGAATVWTLRDVTQDRSGQESVFQELQHAIDFLDHAPAGFLSIAPDGAVPYLNATLAGWLGHDLAQVGSGGLVLSDLAPSHAVALISAIRGEAGEVRTEIMDVDLRKRSGQLLPVRLHHDVAFGQDGRAGASRTLVLNREGAEGHGMGGAAEARFARFFHATPMAIATLGPGWTILKGNASFARLALRDTNNLPPDLMSLIAERDWPHVQPALEAVAQGISDIAPVDVSLRGDGDRAARLFVTPSVDAEGGEERAILYALETTDERKLKENIDQAQKMQAVGQLAGGIAHDFNNVLQVIINASDFLLASHRPADPSFQDIIQIKQNALRAAALVRQLLAFSRRQTLRPQVIEMGDVLSDLTMMLKRAVGDAIDLDVRQGRDLWPVKADVGQLEQVIVNLAVNARDAMPSGGRLALRTRNADSPEVARMGRSVMPAADYVLLEVEDTGSGIAPEHLEKIFEPFFTTKEVGRGTGLGLSMVYGIVKQTGGFVFCDSEVGRGTIFSIFLPRHIPTAEETQTLAEAGGLPASAPAIAPDHTGKGTILLVEDEDAVRALNARMLISRGYTVLEAESGVAALQRLEDHGAEVDLVVSDVVMPEMDGPTLLKELRKRNPATKVVFVSGYAEEAFARNLPEGEAFHFLPKPFTMKQLMETVKAAIG